MSRCGSILLLTMLSACRTTPAPALRVAPTAKAAHVEAATLPGGVTCLLKLVKLGVPHRVVKADANVHTPVEITGSIGGVSYLPLSRRSPRAVCDCRLVLALTRAAPMLRSLGVKALYYSSFFRRGGRGGKLSRHAMGLAVDVHRVRFAEGLHDVKDDFDLSADSDGRCRAQRPLNRLACRLQRDRFFDRVLTPHTDAAHHNHFHLAILSLERRRRPPSRRLPSPVILD